MRKLNISLLKGFVNKSAN